MSKSSKVFTFVLRSLESNFNLKIAKNTFKIGMHAFIFQIQTKVKRNYSKRNSQREPPFDIWREPSKVSV